MQHGQLDLFGQTGKKALDIYFAGVPALRLQKQLVSLLVGETHHLLFETGTVTRPLGINGAGRDGRAMQILPYNLQGLVRGIDRVARQLRPPLRHRRDGIDGIGRQPQKSGNRRRLGAHLELEGHVAPRLEGRPREIDGPGINPRRCVRLQPHQRETQVAQAGRQAHRRELAGPSGRPALLPG